MTGITRDLVFELVASSIAYTEGLIIEPNLRGADEIWLTSSTKKILPVTKLDEVDVETGRPGAMWMHMTVLYQNCQRRLRVHIADVDV